MAKISYSQLSLYTNCPHQWKLRYIGTFKQDSTQKWNHIKLSEKYEGIDE